MDSTTVEYLKAKLKSAEENFPVIEHNPATLFAQARRCIEELEAKLTRIEEFATEYNSSITTLPQGTLKRVGRVVPAGLLAKLVLAELENDDEEAR